MTHIAKTLHSYQVKAIGFILQKRKCALYLGMGLGKTIISLTAITKLIAMSKQPFKILVIGPLRVINNVWHSELKLWPHTSHLTWSIITGTESQRFKALNKEADFYLINRENVVWLYKNKYITWDMIIIDESSSFKNSTSKRFKALKNFKYDYMVQLTGTPSPNGLLDLWSQIYLLDKGERLGKAMYIYKSNYFISDYFGYNFTPKDPQSIYNKIDDITLSLKTEDYITLPPKIDVTTYVDIGNKKLYEELKKEFLINVESKEILAQNAATLTGKLLQFCNGAIYDEYKNIIEIHDSKLSALEDIIEDYPNDNIVVAYNFISDLNRLRKRFKTAVTLNKDGSNIKDWNDGKIKLLLCHPASSGKGLNLQQGGNIIVWFGLTWNLEDYLQFNARLHRQGQLKPVIINHIIAKEGIDRTVMDMLHKKEMDLNSLLDFLKL